MPKTIRLDNGPQFIAREFNDVQILNKTLAGVYSTQSIDSERVNRPILAPMDDHLKGDAHVGEIAGALRNVSARQPYIMPQHNPYIRVWIVEEARMPGVR